MRRGAGKAAASKIRALGNPGIQTVPKALLIRRGRFLFLKIKSQRESVPDFYLELRPKPNWGAKICKENYIFSRCVRIVPVLFL